jgi:hypothetical protein
VGTGDGFFPSTLFPLSTRQLLYWNLGLGGSNIPGNCVELGVLFSDKIPTSLITHVPVSMSLFSVSGEEMLGIHDHSNSLEVEKVTQSVRCSDRSVVDRVVTDWRYFDIEFELSYECEGNVWGVLRCDKGSMSMVLCVNCTNLSIPYCDLDVNLSSLVLIPPLTRLGNYRYYFWNSMSCLLLHPYSKKK